ncbi:MAG: polysaccharide pyruvyl transferase family protein, partial [Candidatus Omnitrophica bacterium]|nr:polysaccharide pyruvyl transferase family protein [Candidatus Omnitrophota bacterium]
PQKIYARDAGIKSIVIEPKSAGIIPNVKILKNVKLKDAVCSFYGNAVKRIISSGMTAYIMRFAYEDLWLCEEVYSMFSGNDKVRILRNDFDAIELESIIKQFDFIVASRYHSIIHSYKNSVPVLAIGWAAKYKELLEHFGQSEYLIDTRGLVSIDEINIRLKRIMGNCAIEKRKIADRIKKACAGNMNIFDELMQDI